MCVRVAVISHFTQQLNREPIFEGFFWKWSGSSVVISCSKWNREPEFGHAFTWCHFGHSRQPRWRRVHLDAAHVKSCHKHEWVMSHLWTSHWTLMDESCHVCVQYSKHNNDEANGFETLYIKESCHVYEKVVFHTSECICAQYTHVYVYNLYI